MAPADACPFGAAFFVRRAKGSPLSGCESRPATAAPAGSSLRRPPSGWAVRREHRAPSDVPAMPRATPSRQNRIVTVLPGSPAHEPFRSRFPPGRAPARPTSGRVDHGQQHTGGATGNPATLSCTTGAMYHRSHVHKRLGLLVRAPRGVLITYQAHLARSTAWIAPWGACNGRRIGPNGLHDAMSVDRIRFPCRCGAWNMRFVRNQERSCSRGSKASPASPNGRALRTRYLPRHDECGWPRMYDQPNHGFSVDHKSLFRKLVPAFDCL